MRYLSVLLFGLCSFSVSAQQEVAGVDGRCLAALNAKKLLSTYQLVDNYLVVYGSKAPPEIKVKDNQTIMITRTGMAKVGPGRSCDFDKEVSTYSVMADALTEVAAAPLSRFSSKDRMELLTACQLITQEKVSQARNNLAKSLQNDTNKNVEKKVEE